MECRRSGEATTGFGVVSKGLLRAENAWTTLELRPDSACLESAWPSFISHNLRSHSPQSGVLLRRRGRVRSRLVGVEERNPVVDTRVCRHTANPGANVTFDVSGKKRVEESKYANFSSCLFFVSRLLFVYPGCVRFPRQNVSATNTFACLYSIRYLRRDRIRWKESHGARETGISSSRRWCAEI